MYNHKLFDTLPESKHQDIWETLLSMTSDIDIELWNAFNKDDEFPHPCKLIPGKVESIWRFYAQFKTFREQHEKYLLDMRDTVSYAICFMYRITEICGHTQYGCRDSFEENYTFTDEDWDNFVEWVDGFYISDYGFPMLNNLNCELWSADDPEHLLITIDRIMNVWHGSGPLADRFIIGGIQSLNKLAFSTAA